MRQMKILSQKLRKIGKISQTQLCYIHQVHLFSHPSEFSHTNKKLTSQLVVEFKSLDSNSL